MQKTNNLKDIFIVTKFTMCDMVKRKSFRISTLIILILIVVGFNVPRFLDSLGGENSSNTVILSDPDNLYGDALDSFNQAENGLDYHFDVSTQNIDEIKDRIANDDASSAIIISHDTANNINLNYIVKNSATATPPTTIIDALSSLYVNLQIQKLDLSAKELAMIFPNFNFEISQTDDQEVGGNIGVMMILSCILFFAIYFCAFQVSSSITVEKTSKIIETLVTSTNPRSIILGKTIGIGLVGLGQILLFVIVAIISAYSFLDPELLNTMLDLSNFTPYLAIITIFYFIFGYFVYALLYAVTGATVSKPEDIQAANTPVVILTMIGFYLAYFTLMNPTGELNTIASLLPISSPFCMPLRVMMGVASGWDVCLSIIILLITCIAVAHIAIKIYDSAILNYGNNHGIKNLFKMYKEK